MTLYIPRNRQVVEKKCPNGECCEHDVVHELPAWEELGGLFLYREDEIYCRECGTEMISTF